MKTVIGITGTTSVGKSAVAVKLAEMLNTEVISADSMQIYKGMNIGTAKIMPDEMHGIRHYMLDIAEPCENYSSYLYQESASRIIESLPSVPIVVGGTGFYFDSLVYPPEFGNCDRKTAAKLKKTLSENGIEVLCKMLCDLDKDTYDAIDLSNPKRVLRAGEGEKRPQVRLEAFCTATRQSRAVQANRRTRRPYDTRRTCGRSAGNNRTIRRLRHVGIFGYRI